MATESQVGASLGEAPTAVCTKCMQEKPLDQFGWRSKAKGRRLRQCKRCRVDVQMQSYVPTPRESRFREVAGGTEQRCGTCREWKPLAQFSWANRALGLYQKSCKPCAAAATQRYNQANSEKRRDTWRRYRRDNYMLQKYNLTFEQYWVIFDLQDGCCAVCRRTAEEAGMKHSVQQLPLHVDHCHESNEVRGLLCRFCNQGLGSFGDDVERLRRAVVYLELDRAVKVNG